MGLPGLAHPWGHCHFQPFPGGPPCPPQAPADPRPASRHASLLLTQPTPADTRTGQVKCHCSPTAADTGVRCVAHALGLSVGWPVLPQHGLSQLWDSGRGTGPQGLSQGLLRGASSLEPDRLRAEGPRRPCPLAESMDGREERARCVARLFSYSASRGGPPTVGVGSRRACLSPAAVLGIAFR